MRAFVLFLGLMLLSLAAIGVFTYPAWLLLHPHFDFPFHRIGERIGMLALIIGFLLLAPRARLADKVSLGYGAPRRQFIRELLKALALGVLTMLLVVAVMAVLGLLSWSDRLPANGWSYARLIANRLLSGIAVGFIEETLLRGAMYTAIARESGTRSAIVLTSIVYAATHFFASFHIAPEAVTPYSGLVLLQGTLHAFADPLAIGDAFLCLCAVGAVLATIRALTGNIAACIGLHAGWVWVMLVAHELTRPVRDQPLSFLLSRFDGFVGWLVLGWTIVLGFALYRFYAPVIRPRGG
ncbi:MAG: CPBP family intramembrane metalloprotease [Sinobacteraceae bacterium]|nr:CPBP family intramembrane metalloprotease [Nevskiaceae bacterium]MBV8851819.1 CPBP family intramembrane metalloprotease [Nevskiaceae bacterium]MBV9911222.1 CPBP family intramembrane metalloprotease [Nevskiaceae bacterium]